MRGGGPDLVFIIGTRAQLVKVAPVIKAAADAGVAHAVWLTGQHRESIDDLIADFALASEFQQAGAQKERATIGSLFGWLPAALAHCVAFLRARRAGRAERPFVIVHGDTLSTLIGAVAARIAGGRVVHLESGLTSGKLLDPFPEELTRRLVFRLTEIAFCPNAQSAALMRSRRTKHVVDTRDNTILDAVRMVVKRAAGPIAAEAPRRVVVSVHRFQNIYDAKRLAAIVQSLAAIARHFELVFVLHPATAKRLEATGLMEQLRAQPSIRLSPRLPYSEFLQLAARSGAVITDGGSNQEELAYLGVPTVVLRDRSERPDGLGANALLEVDLPQPLVEFFLGGDVESLRRPHRLDTDSQPSRQVIESLVALARA